MVHTRAWPRISHSTKIHFRCHFRGPFQPTVFRNKSNLNQNETKSKEQKNGIQKKAHRGQCERYRLWWQYENGSERGSRFMLGSQRSHCHNKTNSGFVDSTEGVGRKGQMSSTNDRYRAGILDGHRDRQIRSLQFPRHSHSGR